MLVDKPFGVTSFRVVDKLRYLLKKKYKVKKLKVGHAGTLDPLATGLLILCTGKLTKSINDYMAQNKVYVGTITLGATTPSYDLETAFDQIFPFEHIGEEQLIQAAVSLTGRMEQTPPIFSAKKIDGEAAYEKARRGEDVVMRKAPVIVNKFELTRIELPEVDFLIECSKGTYIRSLAHDFGKKLNNGAHLSALRRAVSGNFNISQAKSMEEWEEIIAKLTD
ncbi:MAG: tRNA pseudouridine(55) synthase TruB [Flavobacteriales bacterium]